MRTPYVLNLLQLSRRENNLGEKQEFAVGKEWPDKKKCLKENQAHRWECYNAVEKLGVEDTNKRHRRTVDGVQSWEHEKNTRRTLPLNTHDGWALPNLTD